MARRSGNRVGENSSIHDTALIHDCEIGDDTTIWAFVNAYECVVGSNCMIGPYVEIQPNVEVGDGVSIQSHSFVCDSAMVEDDAWIGHGVMTVNNRYPPGEPPWEELRIGRNAVVGTNATLMPVEIGDGAMVGAGAVVVDDVPPGTTVAGNPAEPIE